MNETLIHTLIKKTFLPIRFSVNIRPMQIRRYTPVFFPCPFLHKKILTVPLSHGPAPEKKRPARFSLPRREGGRDGENNVPTCGAGLGASQYTVPRMRHRGVVEAEEGAPGVFFSLSSPRGPSKTTRERGSPGRSGGTASGRKHRVDGEKNSGNEGGEEIPGERGRGRGERPLRYPEWHRFLSTAEDVKKKKPFSPSKKNWNTARLLARVHMRRSRRRRWRRYRSPSWKISGKCTVAPSRSWERTAVGAGLT